jgi:succinate dehydrogenase hydrophobic anchor subunit
MLDPFFFLFLTFGLLFLYLIYRHLRKGLVSLLNDYVKLPRFIKEILVMFDFIIIVNFFLFFKVSVLLGA